MKSIHSMLEFLILDGLLLFSLFFSITWFIVWLQQLGIGSATNARLSQLGIWRGAALASFGGLVTPFCSCSTVPVLTGMLRARVRLGSSFAFLVASPVINEGVIALLLGKSGVALAIAYVIAAGLLTTLAGVLVETLGMSRFLRPLAAMTGTQAIDIGKTSNTPSYQPSKVEAAVVAARMAWLELKAITPYLLAGLIVGAVIYGFVPETMLLEISQSVPPTGLIVLAAAIGIPIYISPLTAVPIGYALLERGFPVGALVAFLVSAVGSSVPEMILLWRLFRWQLLAAHIAVVLLSAVALGMLIGGISPFMRDIPSIWSLFSTTLH